jgi:antitoxin component of MazEF toxin-antitoxin module
MIWMKEVGQITSNLGQKEMPERPKEMAVQIQLTQGEAINFFIQAHQVKLETMPKGEAEQLAADSHQVTRVLQRDLVSEQGLMELLGEETLVGKTIPAHSLTPMIL